MRYTVGIMKKNGPNKSRNYLILLFAFIIFESLVITYFVFQYQNIQSNNNFNASISLKLISSSNMVSTLNLTLLGQGENLTLPLFIQQSKLLIGNHTQQNSTINTTQKSQITIPYRSDSIRNIVFVGLRPNSNYNIKVIGSSKPYCHVGYMCPLYVLDVNKSINIITGKQGSVSNVSIRLS